MSNADDGLQKVVTYVDYPQEAYAGHMWTSMGNVCVMYIGVSPAGCTSIQITGTLGYRLFVTVFT
jgi:hypothetical protein